MNLNLFVIFLCSAMFYNFGDCAITRPLRRSTMDDNNSNNNSDNIDNNIVKTDLIQDNFNWSCANNATCLKTVSQEILSRLRQKKSFQFGVINVEPLENVASSNSFSGRSLSFWDIISGNSVRIPIGPMMLSVQKSDDYKDYLEVALLKQANEGRQGILAGGDGGGLGGGLGGGGGGGGGAGHRNGNKKMQMYIPMFLAFNAVGWMMLALKAVATLTVKALIVSKLALIVAATVVIKKLMDSATEKMFAAHHFEHPEPMMMPYNMDYGLQSHSYHGGSDMGANDLYSLHMAAAAGGGGGGVGGGAGGSSIHDIGQLSQHNGGQEGIVAESSINHVVNLQNVTQQQNQHLIGMQPIVPKVKRQDRDMWAGLRKRPLFYNYIAAAAAARNPTSIYRK